MSAQAPTSLSSYMIGPIPDPATFPYFTRHCSSTGNDTTGTGTTVNPYLTPERAARDYIWKPKGTCFRVDMTNYGTYHPTVPFPFPPTSGGLMNEYMGPGYESAEGEGTAFGSYPMADFEIYAKPQVILTIPGGATISDASYTLAGDGTAPNHVVITVPGASYTMNQYKDLPFLFSGDSFTGFTGTVVSNTTNTITLTIPYDYVYYFGTTLSGYAYPVPDFVISQQTCTIDIDFTTYGNYGWLQTAYYRTGFNGTVTIAGINFLGVDSNDNSGNSVDIGFSCKILNFVMCKNVSVSGSVVESLNVNACAIRQELSAICINDMTVTGCTYQGLFAFSNEGPSRLVVSQCYGDDQHGAVGYGDSIGEGFYHGAGTAYAGRQTLIYYTTHQNTGRGGCRAVGPNNYMVIGNCHFAGCGYGGARMEWGAKLFIVGPVSGTGNAAGIYLLDDSKCFIAPYSSSIPSLDATNITVTGTGGLDIGFTDGPALPWTTFFAIKAFQHPTSFAHISQRTPNRPSVSDLALRVVAVSDVPVGVFCKIYPGAAGSISLLNNATNGDLLYKATAVVFQAATNGTSVYVYEKRGQEVPLQLDSAGAVTAYGQDLFLSATNDGYVSTVDSGLGYVASATSLGAAGSLVKGIWNGYA